MERGAAAGRYGVKYGKRNYIFDTRIVIRDNHRVKNAVEG